MNKKNKQNLTQTTVILGAGLAGLSAAYELSKAGRKVIVVEKADEVGGLARTIKVGDFQFDTGPHRWYSKSDLINNWMLQVLGKETIKVPRLTRIYFDKKFFNYPIQIVGAMKNMGILRSIQSVLDYFFARILFRFHKRRPKTLEEGYIEQFGNTLYQTFFNRYSQKLWGRKCSEISADWIQQRSRGFNITTILKEALFKPKNTVSFVDEFSYPKNGIGQLSYKLRDGVTKSGGKIFLNSEVVKINQKNKKIISVEVKTKKGMEKIIGNQFICSIPISDLVKILSPKVDSKILKVNSKLQYRDEVQVVLFVNKANLTKDTWIYVHPFEIPFMRFMEMDNWSSFLSPKGTTSLVFEIACNEGDQIWRKSDKDLIELVSKDYIKEFGYINKENILGGYVYRVSKEYPVYHLGYKEDLQIIKDYLSEITNLQLIGRNGIFRYNNMDHSIEMGLYSAWNIINNNKKHDIDSVNIEREYLEEKKIEIPEDELVEKPNN